MWLHITGNVHLEDKHKMFFGFSPAFFAACFIVCLIAVQLDKLMTTFCYKLLVKNSYGAAYKQFILTAASEERYASKLEVLLLLRTEMLQMV